MRKIRRMIFTTVAVVGFMGLTTGIGNSAGTRDYSGEVPKAGTSRTTGSATGGTTEAFDESRSPRGVGAHTTIKRDFTVEQVAPGTGGTTGTGAGGTIDRGTGGTMDRGPGGTYDTAPGGTIERDRDTGGTIDRGTGGTMDRGTGGTYDTAPGGTMDRGTGGTLDRGTGGTIDRGTGGTMDRGGGTYDTAPGGTMDKDRDAGETIYND